MIAMKFIICGDLNMHINSDKFKELIELCNDTNLKIYDYTFLNENSFTYVSELNNSTTWLDHFIVSNSIAKNVLKCWIDYDCIVSDHLPICLLLDVQVTANNRNNSEKLQHRHMNWKSSHIVKNYHYLVMKYVNSCKLNNIILCTNNKCKNLDHITDINTVYDSLT